MAAAILVVDDEPDFLTLIRFNLERLGYRVRTARNGVEALEQARTQPPDLIVLDAMLPDLDGFSVCALLQGDALTRRIPVLMNSALSGQIARANGLEAGARDFLTKSFGIARLIGRIEGILSPAAPRIPGSDPDCRRERKELIPPPPPRQLPGVK